MFNLDRYLDQPDSLDFNEALAIYNQIAPTTHMQDADFCELYGDVIDAAARYAKMRNHWLVMGQLERVAIDNKRTNYHNTFMNSLVILARYQTKIGGDGTWLARLGDPALVRKRLGDFAGYLLLFGGLGAR